MNTALQRNTDRLSTGDYDCYKSLLQEILRLHKSSHQICHISPYLDVNAANDFGFLLDAIC